MADIWQDGLPPELWLAVGEFLDLDTLLRARETCKRLAILLGDNLLWYKHYVCHYATLYVDWDEHVENGKPCRINDRYDRACRSKAHYPQRYRVARKYQPKLHWRRVCMSIEVRNNRAQHEQHLLAIFDARRQLCNVRERPFQCIRQQMQLARRYGITSADDFRNARATLWAKMHAPPANVNQWLYWHLESEYRRLGYLFGAHSQHDSKYARRKERFRAACEAYLALKAPRMPLLAPAQRLLEHFTRRGFFE